jgi:predicted nucleotidyltransferase
MVTEERRIEVEQFLARVCAWSLQRPDVVAVALVGSWACGHPEMDSDVDLVVLTTDKPAYLREESWVAELGGTRSSVHRTGGPSTPSAGSCFPRGWR